MSRCEIYRVQLLKYIFSGNIQGCLFVWVFNFKVYTVKTLNNFLPKKQ